MNNPMLAFGPLGTWELLIMAVLLGMLLLGVGLVVVLIVFLTRQRNQNTVDPRSSSGLPTPPEIGPKNPADQGTQGDTAPKSETPP